MSVLREVPGWERAFPELFPQDLMHDLVEGPMKLVLQELIRALGTVGLNLDDLSELLRAERKVLLWRGKSPDLPRLSLTTDGTIQANAGELIALTLIFPLVLDRFFSHPDTSCPIAGTLAVFSLLHQFLCLSMSSSFSASELAELDSIGSRFVMEWIRLCPHRATPKFHYLAHMSLMVRRCML